MNTQKGFTHVFIVVGLLALTVGALSVVFVKNFVEFESPTAEKVNELITQIGQESQKPVNLKTYVSPSGSGLSFSYPDSWSFDSTVGQKSLGNGTKVLLLMLTSED